MGNRIDKIDGVWIGEGNASQAPPEAAADVPTVNVYQAAQEAPVARPTPVQGRMAFTVTHRRAMFGNDIFVRVESTEPLLRVLVSLDGTRLGQKSFSGRTLGWDQTFPGAGGTSPGRKHIVEVTATDVTQTQDYTQEWEDVI